MYIGLALALNGFLQVLQGQGIYYVGAWSLRIELVVSIVCK